MSANKSHRSPRMNLWDFDDTLAHSDVVVARLAAAQPSVPYWKWWHDVEFSTVAISQTAPITEQWLKLLAIPGHHAILTGRNGESVQAWLEAHREHPVIGEAVKRITVVHSTSSTARAHIDTAFKKADIIKGFISEGYTVHLYDDRKLNLTEAAKVGAKVHHVTR